MRLCFNEIQVNRSNCIFILMGFVYSTFYLQVWCGTFSTATSHATRIGRFRRWERASRWWATHIVTRHTGNINGRLESGIFHFYCTIKLNLNLLKMFKATGGGGDDDDNDGIPQRRNPRWLSLFNLRRLEDQFHSKDFHNSSIRTEWNT